ncbi:MAG: hypothetical protein ACJAUD_001913 [Crocinitomicaceae bacterium]|jgi:hypothetical protein
MVIPITAWYHRLEKSKKAMIQAKYVNDDSLLAKRTQEYKINAIIFKVLLVLVLGGTVFVAVLIADLL